MSESGGGSESQRDEPAQAPPPRRDPARVAGVARLTPYEMVFGEVQFENRIFPSMAREADERREDPARRERFGFLSIGAETLREVVPADSPPDALEQYRALLFHSFNFWRFGRRLLTLDAATARYLVEGSPTLEGWSPVLPHPSVYVQLPPNLFWASIAPDEAPEPVDGFFAVEASASDPIGPGYRQLDILMVLGIRRERAGFSVIGFDTEVGPGIPLDWAEGPGREDGRDFASVLPGGEMAGLYSIVTAAEALRLVARALWYVDQHPQDVLFHTAPERRTTDRPGSIALSRLPYHRVGLSAEPAAPAASEAAPRVEESEA